MEAGETTHVPSQPDTPKADPARKKRDPGRRRIKVRITLYFDGTGNNKTNTDHRTAQDETFRRMTEGDEFQQSSYFNDYSNVARLEQYSVSCREVSCWLAQDLRMIVAAPWVQAALNDAKLTGLLFQDPATYNGGSAVSRSELEQAHAEL